MNNFHYARYLLQSIYDITTSKDNFEELGLQAFRLIGNKRWRTYRYISTPEDNTIELPCNFIELEAITTQPEDWNYTTNIHNYGDINSHIAEQYTESLKHDTHMLYEPGRLVRYERAGDKLYFKEKYGPICIVYRGEVVDDEGLPEITDAEAMAIAAWVGYVLRQKEFFKLNDKSSYEKAQLIKRDWDLRCTQARIPEHISQNEFDEILDAKTSWNRKVFNKSFKPVH